MNPKRIMFCDDEQSEINLLSLPLFFLSFFPQITLTQFTLVVLPPNCVAYDIGLTGQTSMMWATLMMWNGSVGYFG